MLAYVDEADKVVKIVPDPSRYPFDASIVIRCRRFASNLEILDHPSRVNYPLKRIGQRGSGKWQQVTWNEAMDAIATRLLDLKEGQGAETLATCIGAPHSIYWPLHRFLNLFGSPNNIGIGHICWNPAIWVQSITYGWPIEPELDPALTQCAILWGVNPAESDSSLLWKIISQYRETDHKLIVIDPRYTETAAMADYWVPIQPGSDGALALSLLHVIINENLYDHDFVARWCHGFDQLCRRVADYSPDRVSGIIDIESGVIVEIAHLFATLKPATIFSGLGIDQSGLNCTQTLRSLAILRAITGNLDKPGACHLGEKPDYIPESSLELTEMLSPAQRQKKLGNNLFRLQNLESFEKLSRYTQLQGKQLPARYLTSAHPYLAWQAMITGKPYPIRALIVMASNPMLTQANTRMVYTALKNLDLLVVLEEFITPTAMLADYVLPIAGSLEHSMVQTNGGVSNVAYGGTGVVSPLYQRRTDYAFWYDLALRCGQTEYWPWKTLETAYDYAFAPAGLNWPEFCRTGLYSQQPVYQKYESAGFTTPSGKVELYSGLLEKLGYDPLPNYSQANNKSPDYPLELITGIRHQPYFATEFRQINKLRRVRPEPIVEMGLKTAAQLNLNTGERVWVETPEGRIKHILQPVEMKPGVVAIEYGWWFPELTAEEPSLGGVWKSNANLLTRSDIEGCDPILGQWSYRTLHCRVYKVKEKE